MSVSFSTELSTIVGFTLVCACGNERTGEPLPYDELCAEFADYFQGAKILDGCEEDCAYYGAYSKPVTEGPETVELRMCNNNARPVLEALGYGNEATHFEDMCFGSDDAASFLGRVMVAQAAAPVSAEHLSFSEQIENGPTVIYGGRPEGYVQEKLEALRSLAEFAVEHNRRVLWG